MTREMKRKQGGVLLGDDAMGKDGEIAIGRSSEVSSIRLQDSTGEGDLDEAHGSVTRYQPKRKSQQNGWRSFVYIILCDALVFVLTFMFLLWCEKPCRKRSLVVKGSRITRRVRRTPCSRTGRKFFLVILYLQGTHPGFCEMSLSQESDNFDRHEGGHEAFLYPGRIPSPGNAEEATWELIASREADWEVDFPEESVLCLMSLGSHFGLDPGQGVGEPRSLETLPDVAENSPRADEDDEDAEDSDGDSDMSPHYTEASEAGAEDGEDTQHVYRGTGVDRQSGEPLNGEGPYSVSEGMDEDDWDHFFQFRRHHIQRHCYLRWNNYNNIIRNIANTWDVGRNSIFQLIMMTGEVDGIPNDAKKAIVVIRDDDPSSDERPHVLVDVVWHTLLIFREGPQIHRRVLRLSSPMARSTMLLAAEVGGYCQDQRDRCLVSLNGVRVALQDFRTHSIPPGSYVRIEVPPIEECSHEEVNLLQLGVSQRISFRDVGGHCGDPFPLERSSEMRFNDTAASFENRLITYMGSPTSCRSGWRYHSFENLSTPGNPAPIVYDIATDDEEPNPSTSQFQTMDIDTDSEEDKQPFLQPPIRINVSLPEGIASIMKVLQPWDEFSLELDFDPACPLLPVSLQFLSGCSTDRVADELYIYTDGSLSRSSGVSAFAFAVFGWSPHRVEGQHSFLGWYARTTITQQDHPNFTGACTHAVDEAEAAALIWALIWLLQSGLRVPCYFCFDSLNIGRGASGSWNVRSGWLQGERLRELAQYADALRAGCPIYYQHVKAHSLQPGNEIVDALAYSTSHNLGRERADNLPLLPDWKPLFSPECKVMAWAWWATQSYFDRSLPEIQHDRHSWDYYDWRGSASVQNLEHHVETQEPPDMEFQLQLATYNVMTLKAKDPTGEDFAGLGAAHLLRQQLQFAGYHVIGLQETRANQQCTFVSENYLRYVSGSTESRGHRGVELWISRSLSVTRDTDHPIYLQDKDVAVLHSEDDLLVAMVNCAGHLLVVFVCHAPYDGAEGQRKELWWTKFDTLLTKYRRKGRVVMLGDFNARLGRSMEASIGDRLCERTNDNGERMEAILRNHSLWLPSTYSSIHASHDETWTHPRGHKSRLDYIGLDMLASWTVTWSGVDESIQTTHTAMDHSLVGLVIHWNEAPRECRVKRNSYDWEAMASEEGRLQLQNMLKQIPALPWTCEVHHQWDFYDACIHEGLRRLFPPPKRKSRSDIFTQKTWDLLEKKAKYKSHLRELDGYFDNNWLTTAWRAWKTGVSLRLSRRQEWTNFSAVHLARLRLLNDHRYSAKALRSQTAEDKASYVQEVIDRVSQASTTDVFKELRLLRVGS